MSKRTKSHVVRVALIGCGRISKAHLESIQALSQLELRYACDIDRSRAREAARVSGAEWLTDYKRVPLDEVDVVAIATPNYLHYEMAKYFLERGKHIIVEKPMTIHLRDSERLVALAKKHRRYVFAVKQVRFNPAVRVLKEAVAKGKLGKLLSCNLIMHWNRPQAYFDKDAWRGKKRLDGGTFINQGIHYLDLLVWIGGAVKSVYAVADTLNHDIEVEDHLSAILRFKNGMLGTIEFNVNTYLHNLECSILMQGAKGTVKVGGQAANAIELWEVEKTPQPAVKKGIPPNVYARGLYQGSCPNHVYVYQNVLDVLSGVSRQVATSAESATETMRVMDAIYRSAKSGKRVTL
jgi:UDP-N-acetyl-2-amino-2-deoxyglucuronate dehydrogenase